MDGMFAGKSGEQAVDQVLCKQINVQMRDQNGWILTR